jgi:SNF2 family DNA or RNA helicase
MAMTGTSISRDLTDEWSQYGFLEEGILGHRFLTSFRNDYCIMGGYEGKEVVGVKNLERYQERVRPLTFVTTKEELDLPPQIWDKFHFEMSPEQKGHYVDLKKTFITKLDSGELVTVANAAVLITRLQQITCGRLVDEDGRVIRLLNPRLEALEDLLADRDGKVVIWARFQEDIRDIAALLGEECVTYYGETTSGDRALAKQEFMRKGAGPRYFVSTPAAGGTGLDGLQTVCNTAVYYSNSYNAIDRWQSEDRIHRIGTMDGARYTDLVCKG